MYRWGTPPRRVTRLAGPGRLLRGVGFLHVKAAELGNPPNRGNQITTPMKARQNTGQKNMAGNYERGELFWRFRLQNRQNADEIDSAGGNLGVDLDSQANQLNQTKVLPGTTTLKRKELYRNKR